MKNIADFLGLGFFSTVVFWWIPFSGMLASVGLALGLFSLLRGVRGGLRGENYALAGTALCAASLTIGGNPRDELLPGQDFLSQGQ